MPSIIKNDQQMLALAEIRAALDEVRVINTALKADLKGCKLTTSSTRKFAITIDDKFKKKLASILVAQKEKRAKEIKAKAEKFAIALDDDDLAILSSNDENGAPEEIVSEPDADYEEASETDAEFIDSIQDLDERESWS